MRKIAIFGLANHLIWAKKIFKQNVISYVVMPSDTELDNILTVWKNYDCIVVLCNHAIYGYMYLTKEPNLVVASVTDVHSAHMTIEHNNSHVVLIPMATVGFELAIEIIKNIINATYEDGRHRVRIDMLNKELES